MNHVEQSAASTVNNLIRARQTGSIGVVLASDMHLALSRLAVLVSWCVELNADVEALGGTRTRFGARHAFMRTLRMPEGSAVWVGWSADDAVRQWQVFATLDSADGDPVSNLLLTVLTFGGIALFVTTADHLVVQPIPKAGAWTRLWPHPTDGRLSSVVLDDEQLMMPFGQFTRTYPVPVLDE